MNLHLDISWFFALSYRSRRFVLISLDIFLLLLAVWFSFWLRLAEPFHPLFLTSGIWVLIFSVLIGIPLYSYTGQYLSLTRYVGSFVFYQLAFRNGLLVLCLFSVGNIFNLPLPPRSSWILLWLLLTVFTGSIRFVLRDILLSIRSSPSKLQLRVVIYGAGEAGAQLAAALHLAGNHQIVAFLDDDSNLWGRSINGIPIQAPQTITEIKSSIDQILLAIPSLGKRERRSIIAQFQQQSLPVLSIPSVDDLTSGRARIDSLHPVSIEDLLGRDVVSPNLSLLSYEITDSVVCVTGAGGSIGSELCVQLVKFNPKCLLLLERSEPSLYAIEQKLLSLGCKKVNLVPVLGSACDIIMLNKLFADFSIDVVFHAAAYKHVPLVESNPVSGISNNVFSTLSLCNVCAKFSVRRFVLISSDKAVRPTNVMGATKRVAELIVQAFAQEASCIDDFELSSTRFAIVRFGNVLASSGSVVPLFRSQIASGGPITVTHPEIIRYFMTIPEAAQLVIQASALAKGGDLFLLDMGEPVRITDLAVQMILLSGLSVRDGSNPDGDIEIIFTGLRPGEKLYEELLIDAKSEVTEHPLIFRANEKSISPNALWSSLDSLESSVQNQRSDEALAILSELVPEWERYKLPVS
ncbi:nucleoside-diphosphate sugar epimerase/dehydratase [Synechococcus sp. UW179A]|uniref:polysaccharide biosynthesis protein n=1 Tax=Synechococcus sp. UW179A TaxID=2575510 RepID=UPI000E0E54FE|nr:nucleoside-diphosphate sugar epimerase/dehydratase [Synechococcus sp. UW179A]